MVFPEFRATEEGIGFGLGSELNPMHARIESEDPMSYPNGNGIGSLTNKAHIKEIIK